MAWHNEKVVADVSKQIKKITYALPS